MNLKYLCHTSTRQFTPPDRDLVAYVSAINKMITQDPDCAAIIPAFNEESVVGSVVLSVKTVTTFPVWVIDDHSTDGTAAEASQAGARVIRLPEQLGAWGAVQTGLREAARQGCRYVVTMDSDGQHNPGDLVKLIEPVENNTAEVVVGACPERGSFLRRCAWVLMRLTSGLKNRDLTSGYRVLNRAAIKLLVSQSASQLEYQDVGALLMLDQAGLRVTEVDVVMPARANGKSRIFRSWTAVAYYMAHTLILGFVKRRVRSAPQRDDTQR